MQEKGFAFKVFPTGRRFRQHSLLNGFRQLLIVSRKQKSSDRRLLTTKQHRMRSPKNLLNNNILQQRFRGSGHHLTCHVDAKKKDRAVNDLEVVPEHIRKSQYELHSNDDQEPRSKVSEEVVGMQWETIHKGLI